MCLRVLTVHNIVKERERGKDNHKSTFECDGEWRMNEWTGDEEE